MQFVKVSVRLTSNLNLDHFSVYRDDFTVKRFDIVDVQNRTGLKKRSVIIPKRKLAVL